jgi:uncharacterized protein (DUF58 family)
VPEETIPPGGLSPQGETAALEVVDPPESRSPEPLTAPTDVTEPLTEPLTEPVEVPDPLTEPLEAFRRRKAAEPADPGAPAAANGRPRPREPASRPSTAAEAAAAPAAAPAAAAARRRSTQPPARPSTEPPTRPSRLAPRLTSRGRGVLGAAVLLGAGAVFLRYAELAALSAACLLALVLALLTTARWPAVTVQIGLDPAHVRRGEPAAAAVTLTNVRSRRTPDFVIDVADGPGHASTLRVRGLGGHASHEITIDLDTGVRGVVPVGPAALRRGDPFGLLTRVSLAGGAACLRVRPQTVPLEPLASPRSRDPDGPRSAGTAGGVMFNALREYLPGDDLRFVHWASSAHAGVLLVREHTDPSEPAATVVLDTRRGAYPAGPAGEAAFENAVDVAASVVLAFAARRHPVRLVAGGGPALRSRRQQSGAGLLLDALAEVAPDPGSPASPAGQLGLPSLTGLTRHAGQPGGAGVARQAGITGATRQAGRPGTASPAGLDGLASLPRGGVGTLTLITGVVEAGQTAAISPVVNRFEQVVVVRVGERERDRYRGRDRDRPALRRLRPASRPGPADGAASDAADGDPFRDRGAKRRDDVDDVQVRLAGRLRVITVPTAADLPGPWPAGGSRAVPVRWRRRSGAP